MSSFAKTLEKLKNLQTKEDDTSTLKVFQNPEYKTIHNGQLLRIGKNVEDLIDNFIYQLGTNINQLPKDLKIDFLERTKNDLLASLNKVIT